MERFLYICQAPMGPKVQWLCGVKDFMLISLRYPPTSCYLACIVYLWGSTFFLIQFGIFVLIKAWPNWIYLVIEYILSNNNHCKVVESFSHKVSSTKFLLYDASTVAFHIGFFSLFQSSKCTVPTGSNCGLPEQFQKPGAAFLRQNE